MICLYLYYIFFFFELCKEEKDNIFLKPHMVEKNADHVNTMPATSGLLLTFGNFSWPISSFILGCHIFLMNSGALGLISILIDQ